MLKAQRGYAETVGQQPDSGESTRRRLQAGGLPYKDAHLPRGPCRTVCDGGWKRGL